MRTGDKQSAEHSKGGRRVCTAAVSGGDTRSGVGRGLSGERTLDLASLAVQQFSRQIEQSGQKKKCEQTQGGKGLLGKGQHSCVDQRIRSPKVTNGRRVTHK